MKIIATNKRPFVTITFSISILIVIFGFRLFNDYAHLLNFDYGESESTSMEPGSYGDILWLTTNEIYLIYANRISLPRARDFEFFQYSIITEDIKMVEIEGFVNCVSPRYESMQRISENEGGILASCVSEANHVVTIEYAVFTFGTETAGRKFFQFPNGFQAQDFAYSWTNSVLVAASSGSVTRQRLYIVKDGIAQELFPGVFNTSRAPWWNRDGTKLAFLGNRDSHFPGADQMLAQMNAPVSLFLVDSEFTNIELILADLRFTGRIKWSPVEDDLAFSGEYKGIEGIWIINMQDYSVQRIWDESSLFDWSPDGQAMVIIDQLESTELDNTYNPLYGVPIIRRLDNN